MTIFLSKKILRIRFFTIYDTNIQKKQTRLSGYQMTTILIAD